MTVPPFCVIRLFSFLRLHTKSDVESKAVLIDNVDNIDSLVGKI